MTDKYFDELKSELQKGAAEKDHPFRYFSLATVGVDHMVRQRILVLRKANKDLLLTFFTDYRSKKIMHIRENNRVSLLFYDAVNLIQIRIDGMATIDKEEEAIKSYWREVKGSARRAYTSSTTPGSTVESPELVEYLHEDNYFCAVNVTPFRIEYLRLKDPDHIRVNYSFIEGFWDGKYIAP
ncbi:MAG: pyridoxamine 5'-phosphate oxidase family protein [Flavobacteriaceae bacterium]